MTISAGGFNVNFNPNPGQTAYERQISGEENLRNQGQIGQGSVVIAKDTDLIPFTKFSDPWKYSLNSGHPSLPPTGTIRNSDIEKREPVSNWEQHYSDILNNLSEEILTILYSDLEIAKAARKVLELTAKILAWHDAREVISHSESAQSRTKLAQIIPKEAFNESLNQGLARIELMNSWLERIGLNDPEYLPAKEWLQQLDLLFKETGEAE